MAEEIQRSRGRPSNYRQDRGGVPSEYGPYFGVVMNNVDPTRSGRLQVYIEAFADGSMDDDTKWTTVNYLPPFYGATQIAGAADTGPGAYPGNQTSYGMWFTPPDIGVTVVCWFVDGDRSQGYYISAVPQNGITHMIPAVGAEPNYIPTNANQEAYFENAALMPVTEINANNERIDNAGRFFDTAKPIQSVVAASLFQQGLAKDTERGSIRSSSQRESPSSCFGILTPGVPIYQGGLSPRDTRRRLNSGTVRPQDVKVIGRMGGHSLVMDDGDIDGRNALFRLRTAKGHQIMMNDSENFFYMIHANGQVWIEFGAEGTVDIFSTNSVNIRTQGDINLHADRDINMFAGRDIKMKASNNISIEADVDFSVTAQQNLAIYSKNTIGVKADGSLAIQSASGSWNAGSSLLATAGGIDLNGPAAPSVAAPQPIEKIVSDDTTFNTSTGWQVQKDALTSIASRAPTHEPYPYHNKGVDVKINFEPGPTSSPPGAPVIPAGVQIRAN
jgi:hypothetical protein